MKKIIWGIVFILSLILTSCTNGGIGEEGISKNEFEQIKRGMSQFEVDEIVGGYGEKIAEKEEDHVYSFTYKYQGEKKGYAIITFTADYSDGLSYQTPEVTAMEQHDLR